MRNKRFFLLGWIFITVLLSSSISMPVKKGLAFLGAGVQNENTPPVVKIVSPAANSTFTSNTMLSYSITVSDKEDGESKYQEIPSTEIFLETRSFQDPAEATAYIQKGMQKDHPGFETIKRSDCFNCHSFKDKLIGPSFEKISMRYKYTAENLDLLAGRIRNGSSKIWGEIVMPGHPALTDSETKKMIEWILKNGSDPNLNYYRGAEGSFWCNPVPGSNAKSSIYVLTATYNDHGTDGNTVASLKGQDKILIREKK